MVIIPRGLKTKERAAGIKASAGYFEPIILSSDRRGGGRNSISSELIVSYWCALGRVAKDRLSHGKLLSRAKFIIYSRI